MKYSFSIYQNVKEQNCHIIVAVETVEIESTSQTLQMSIAKPWNMCPLESLFMEMVQTLKPLRIQSQN